ncbi:MAG: hypothetical protein KC425_12475 [Anaerolineales bacterium]|nr:hypothetical protein [Anaerolineales bacterium]
MMRLYSRKLTLQIGTTLTALIALAVILWSIWRVVMQPDLGALWTDSAVVYYARPDGVLREGDQLVNVDGMPFRQSGFPYYRWRYGDLIALEIVRDGQPLVVTMPYVERAPLSVLLTRLSVVFNALVFWGIGAAVGLFAAFGSRQGWLFFLWCQTLAVSLALGSVTSPAWAAHGSLILTWLTVALAIHFHLVFPVSHARLNNRRVLVLIYGVAALGLLRLFIAAGLLQLPPALSAVYAAAFYVWVLVGLVSILGLLIRSHRRAVSAVVKRQIGVVAVSGVVAIVPLLTLSIIPELLFGEAVVSPSFTFLFLIAIPVGYGYAVRRFQFIRLERYISRDVTAVYVVGLLCILYFSITYVLGVFLRADALDTPLANVITIIGLVIVYNPLYRRLQNYVDYLLYGGWYDYPSVVGEVTHTLEQATDIDVLVSTLTQSVQKSMRVQWACLLWRELKLGEMVTHVAGQLDDQPAFERLQVGDLQHLVAFLQAQTQPVTSQTIRQALSAAALSAEERQILNYQALRLWIPIVGLKNSLGILILGPKYGGDVFDTNDMEILRVVARQASVIFQNVQLIGELQAQASENERYQKEITRTREEERKRIARELHDQVIQELVGLKYRLAHVQSSLKLSETNPENNERVVSLQDDIGVLIQTTRDLCQDLRPAALDLGLVPSIRSSVSRFEMATGIAVQLQVEGDRNTRIGEDVALCIYRCTSEALSNIRKHALARLATVCLTLTPERVTLSVVDDGRGFTVPERLGSLMEDNHFGLVGMRERVELLNGAFRIQSHPDGGTTLDVTIPLSDTLV